MRKKIIQLENMPYDSFITVGSHHYARCFSEDHDVLWISLPWHLIQLLTGRSPDRIKAWNRNHPMKMSESLLAYSPFIPLPYRNNPILRSDWFLKHMYAFIPGITRVIKDCGFENPDLLWFTDPRHLSILNYIQPKKVFYRCVDDLEHFADVPPGLIPHERRLIQQADATFFTSKELMEKFSGLSPKVHYLPNGCDLKAFSQTIHPDEIPTEIRGFFRPGKVNLLYTGAIAEWFDFGFLRELAPRPDVHVVVVGPQRVPIPDDLKARENIIFTGPYPFSAMPQFAALAHIGIIPFLLNDITHSVNPIKLHEYCAAGLPTIVSRFKTVVDLQPPAVFYESGAALQALDAAIALQQSPDKIQEIKTYAQANSWRQRYELIQELMEQ